MINKPTKASGSKQRKPMAKPTKAQLVAAVAYYDLSLTSLLAGPFLSAEDYVETLKTILASAPSLAPASSEETVGSEPSQEEAAE